MSVMLSYYIQKKNNLLPSKKKSVCQILIPRVQCFTATNEKYAIPLSNKIFALDTREAKQLLLSASPFDSQFFIRNQSKKKKAFLLHNYFFSLQPKIIFQTFFSLTKKDCFDMTVLPCRKASKNTANYTKIFLSLYI